MDTRKNPSRYLSACFASLVLGFAAVSSIPPASAQIPPVLSWAKGFGGTNVDYANGITRDLAGNVFLSGGFNNTAWAGSDTNLTSRGGDDVFLAKYNGQGRLLWIRQFGSTNSAGPGTSGDACYTAQTDSAGNIYIAGYFLGDAAFESVILPSRGGNDIYVAKFENEGRLLWARRAGGAYHDTALKIAVDATGNCYVPGFFRGKADFGAIELNDSSTTYSDLYVAKYDPQGNVLWAKRAGGNSNDVSHCVALDRGTNVYVTGYFQNTAVFETTTLVGTNNNNFFLARYTDNGSLLWVRSAVGANSGSQSTGRNVVADSFGNAYVAGSFQGTVSFFGTNLVAAGSNDIFLAKYNDQGNLLWVTQAGGTNSDIGNRIALDDDGQIYVIGTFSGVADFGPFQLRSATGTDADIFVAKYNPSGQLVWIKQFGSAGDDNGAALSVDSNKSIVVAGYLGGALTFEGADVAWFGKSDAVCARLDDLPYLEFQHENGWITLSWPTNAPGFSLESSSNLDDATAWTPLTNTPNVVDGRFTCSNRISNSAQFFRLKR